MVKMDEVIVRAIINVNFGLYH